MMSRLSAAMILLVAFATALPYENVVSNATNATYIEMTNTLGSDSSTQPPSKMNKFSLAITILGRGASGCTTDDKTFDYLLLVHQWPAAQQSSTWPKGAVTGAPPPIPLTATTIETIYPRRNKNSFKSRHCDPDYWSL